MEITNNKKAFAFEGKLAGGDLATLTYRWLKGSMVLMHTVVPPAYRGQGLGDELVKYVLDYVQGHGLKIIVYCPFVQKYMERHPEYNGLLDPDYKRA